jgi:hypothetical protein
MIGAHQRYSESMEGSSSESERDPIDSFLSMPARHYDEDEADPFKGTGASVVKMSLRRRLYRFLFEKTPSDYSSISPRKPDGTRTKIFFFNGSGRGR